MRLRSVAARAGWDQSGGDRCAAIPADHRGPGRIRPNARVRKELVVIGRGARTLHCGGTRPKRRRRVRPFRARVHHRLLRQPCGVGWCRPVGLRGRGCRGSPLRNTRPPLGGSNYSGSSLSIAGSSCSGGWLNLPSNWVNRINSTVTYGSGCDRVKHFDSYALSGSYQSTWPNGNLSYMIDRANSVQYL